MIKKILFIATCIIISINVYSQTPKLPQTSLILSVDNGVLLNSLNVENNNVYPNPIGPKKKLLYKPVLALSVQRITKSGFLHGLGLSIGKYKQRFDVSYNTFDFLDTLAVFKDATYYKDFNHQSNYFSIHLFIGYSKIFKISNKKYLNVLTRLTLEKRNYFSGGFYEDRIKTINIPSGVHYLSTYYASTTTNYWGNNGSGLSGPIVTDLYIGVSINTKGGIIDNISLGLYGTRAFSNPALSVSDRASVGVRNSHYNNNDFQFNDVDNYLSREIAVGLRLGIGLNL